MSNEVVKVIFELDQVIEGNLVYINSLNNIFRILSLIKKQKTEFKSNIFLNGWN
jgi:hypothetical protein